MRVKKKYLNIALISLILTGLLFVSGQPSNDCFQYWSLNTACTGTNTYSGCTGLSEPACNANSCCLWTGPTPINCKIRPCTNIDDVCPCSTCTGCDGNNWKIDDGSTCTVSINTNVTGWCRIVNGSIRISKNRHLSCCEGFNLSPLVGNNITINGTFYFGGLK